MKNNAQVLTDKSIGNNTYVLTDKFIENNTQVQNKVEGKQDIHVIYLFIIGLSTVFQEIIYV